MGLDSLIFQLVVEFSVPLTINAQCGANESLIPGCKL